MYDYQRETFKKAHPKVDEKNLDSYIHNYELLEKNSLHKLNEILTNNQYKLDYLTEHNFTSQTIRNNSSFDIEYEPKISKKHGSLQRPPDLYIEKDGVSYWIQIKRLSKSEYENRRSKLFVQIKNILTTIHANKFINLSLSEDFNNSDICLLIEKTKECVKNDSSTAVILNNHGVKIAKIELFTPNKSVFDHLKLGIYGDLDGRWADDVPQITASLNKAVGAFEWDTTDTELNIIVIESDMYENIDIGQAVFGREKSIFKGKKEYFSRDESQSFFHLHTNVAAVISLRRLNEQLISDYSNDVFINEMHVNKLDTIAKIININHVYRYYMIIEQAVYCH